MNDSLKMKINKWGSWVLRCGSFQTQDLFHVMLHSNFTQHNSVFVLNHGFKKKRKWHLRCHTASVSPIYEPSLFVCPWYIISILTRGQSWSLPWVLLLFIHDQIEPLLLQGYFFFQRVHWAAPSLLLMLHLWISSQRWRSSLFHFWSQECCESTKAERSKEKQCCRLSCSNTSHWLI